MSDLDQQVAHGGLVEHRPRRRGLFENAAADGLGLLLLALQFQFARFLLPFLQAGLPDLHLRLPAGGSQVQQAEQWMRGVRFDEVQVPYGAGQRDVQRVDEELVDLQ